jgi:methionyl aminopeptidase
MTTKELDDMIGSEIKKHNSTPTFYMYGEFPGNTCISVNDELIHGIPSDYKIKDGDMITFDVGVTHDGYVCDSAFTVILGKNEIAEKISKATYETLMKTIEIIKPGVCTGDLGNKTEEVAKSYGYEVIKDFSGHGCGKLLHESPSIMNYGKKDTGAPLVSGMTICIEPMLLTGSDKYFIEDNG